MKPWLVGCVSRQAEELQQQIIRETFHLVSKRDDNVCNFLEGGRYCFSNLFMSTD